MTRTVSGMMSSSRRTSFTRRLPATSTSRRGLRSTTFISVPREPRRGLDPTDLPQVHAVVGGGEPPPLAEVHVAEAEVLEGEPARIAAGQALDRLAAARARGLHGVHQRADRLAVGGPHDGRRLAALVALAQRGGAELREVVREHGGRAAGLHFLQQLRGELAGGRLGDREVIDDFAHRPVGGARLEVRLALGQAFHLAQHVGAHALELDPEGFDCFGERHCWTSLGVYRKMLGMTDRQRALARAAWRTLTTREAYANPWIRVREDIAEMPDGRTTLYGVIETKPAIGVLPFLDARTVVLVGQYRYVARDFYWEMPTGSARPGESQEAAAQREL